MLRLKFVVLILLLVALAGCGDNVPTTGYEVRFNDGWSSERYQCETYYKKGNHIQCFDKKGFIKNEFFMTDDIRVFINKRSN